MKGFAIFIHAVRLVMANFRAALGVSVVLLAIQAAVIAAPFLLKPNLLADPLFAVTGGQFPAAFFLLLIIVIILTSLAIAVNWHRYVLLEEEPRLLPTLHWVRMMDYLWFLLMIFLIVLLPAIFSMFVISSMVMAAGSFAVAWLIGVAFSVVLTAVVLRLSIALPGRAIGDPIGIFDGWRSAQGEAATFMVLATLTIVGSEVLKWVGYLLTGSSTTLVMIWLIITQWLSLMVGISILTTLYGHFVEKRSIS